MEEHGPGRARLLSKKDFRKYLAHTLGDPSVLINAANDDLGRMFFFHGARLDTTRVYEMDEMFASILGGTDSLQGKTTFWISSSLTDSYSAVCCTYTEVEDAKKAVSSAVREAMQTVKRQKETVAAVARLHFGRYGRSADAECNNIRRRRYIWTQAGPCTSTLSGRSASIRRATRLSRRLSGASSTLFSTKKTKVATNKSRRLSYS